MTQELVREEGGTCDIHQVDVTSEESVAALFAAIPRMDLPGQELAAIGGRVPPLDAMPAGCRFAPRCHKAGPGCEAAQDLRPLRAGHAVRCHLAT